MVPYTFKLQAYTSYTDILHQPCGISHTNMVKEINKIVAHVVVKYLCFK